MSQYVSILTTEDPALSLSLFLSLSLPLSLSPFLSIYVSLWLQDTCHMMPFTKQHSAYAWVVTCILFLINLTFHNLPLHSSYKIHQPFTDYFLRLPYSELLEKRLFRSRANLRLVVLFSRVRSWLRSPQDTGQTSKLLRKLFTAKLHKLISQRRPGHRVTSTLEPNSITIAMFTKF